MYRDRGARKIARELVRLRSEAHPPVGSYVGLGCFSNPADANQQAALGVHATVSKEDPDVPHPPSELAKLEGKAIVGVSKGLLLATPVVVHHFAADAKPIAEFGSWAELNGFVTRIWPPNGQPIQWPLPKKFGPETFREFGSLFYYV